MRILLKHLYILIIFYPGNSNICKLLPKSKIIRNTKLFQEDVHCQVLNSQNWQKSSTGRQTYCSQWNVIQYLMTKLCTGITTKHVGDYCQQKRKISDLPLFNFVWYILCLWQARTEAKLSVYFIRACWERYFACDIIQR